MANKSKLGGWAFLIGLAVAILIAVFYSTAPPQWSVIVLAVLGLVVGLLNVADKEVRLFLIAAVAFMLGFQALSAVVTSLAFGWTAVGTFFDLLNVFVAPAAAVVALNALYKITKD